MNIKDLKIYDYEGQVNSLNYIYHASPEDGEMFLAFLHDEVKAKGVEKAFDIVSETFEIFSLLERPDAESEKTFFTHLYNTLLLIKDKQDKENV